jgi:C4-dicarboxylate transporter DctM subunit
MDLALVFGFFILLIVLGVPIAVAIGLGAVAGMTLTGIQYSHLITKTFGGVDSTALLAVPFFILAGEIMNHGGVILDLVRFVDGVVGWVCGGLAYVNILASMIFSGVSGSTVADTSAIGSVLIPAMEKKGYDKDFSVAVTVAASTMGPIIPPSILMVVYAHITHVSVGQMFLGGVVPGLSIAVILAGTVFVVCRLRGYAFQEARASWVDIGRSFVRSIGVLVLPVLIVGGILSGVFTATEASAVAVVYGLLFTVLIRRSLRIRDLPRIVLQAAGTSAVVMLIIALAAPFGDLLSRLHFQDAVTGLFFSVSSRPVVILALILLFVLILGCFVEATAVAIMFAGTFAAIGQQLGYHPVHFGVVMVFAMIIGSVTPPVAISLYVGLAIAKISMRQVMGMIWTFIPALVLALVLCALVPQLVLWLPSLVFR